MSRIGGALVASVDEHDCYYSEASERALRLLHKFGEKLGIKIEPRARLFSRGNSLTSAHAEFQNVLAIINNRVSAATAYAALKVEWALGIAADDERADMSEIDRINLPSI
jgi:hypothetical protein